MSLRNIALISLTAITLLGLTACGTGEDPIDKWLGSCISAADQDPTAGRIKEVTYEIIGVRVGSQSTSEIKLDSAGRNREWLVVILRISNNSDSEQNFNSRDFQIDIGSDLISEDGGASGGINKLLGTRDMGNFLGSDIDSGKNSVFAMPYKVPTNADDYRLKITHNGEGRLPLRSAINACPTSKVKTHLTEQERLASTPFVCIDEVKHAPVQHTDETLWSVDGVELIESAWDTGELQSKRDNEIWIVVTYQVQNQSEQSKRFDSDDIWLRVGDDTKVREDGSASGRVNDILGTKDMGNMLGTDIEPGFSERFSTVFVVDDMPEEMAMVIDKSGKYEFEIPLSQHLDACEPLLTSVAVSTPVAHPLPMPTPSPTAVPRTTAKPTERADPRALKLEELQASDDSISFLRNPSQFVMRTATVSGMVIASDTQGDTTVLIVLISPNPPVMIVVNANAMTSNISTNDIVSVTGTVQGFQAEGMYVIDASRVRVSVP